MVKKGARWNNVIRGNYGGLEGVVLRWSERRYGVVLMKAVQRW